MGNFFYMEYGMLEMRILPINMDGGCKLLSDLGSASMTPFLGAKIFSLLLLTSSTLVSCITNCVQDYIFLRFLCLTLRVWVGIGAEDFCLFSSSVL